MLSRLTLKYVKNADKDPTALIKEKIEKAKELYQNFGEYFYKDQKFIDLLRRYEKAVEKSNKMMSKMKSFEECYICTVLEKKGCCKIGLETEVTINILLINYFLKKPVPEEREVPGRCFFVGPVGCKLFARPYICRDYFCKRLLEKFDQAEYALLTQELNEELTLLYQISSYIKNELENLMGEFLLELDITG